MHLKIMEPENTSNPKHSETTFPKEANREQSGKPIGNEPEKKSFLQVVKKVGFSVWVAVMVIGGVLAFLTSLLLL
ncbi:hypothetical protein [Salinimicrobium flavum]|uniref:Uncharacterized protein n=1 Tax=Salinimicrobium flavum TaxID=1737065 RepID=A0ABW5ISM1_9FLAO